MDCRAHIFIYGDVTGVGFRYWTCKNARNKHLSGWVKNVSAGIVEAVFEGKKEEIEWMVDLCRKSPGVSRVKEVKIQWEKAIGEDHDFSIKR